MTSQIVDLHEPKSLFRHLRRVHCPPYVQVSVDDLPSVPRRLLVHRGHMTTTLEELYGGTVSIQVLEKAHVGSWYTRAVLLYVRGCPLPVQFGVMALDLAAVPEDVARRVLTADEPLGRILIEVHPLRTVTPVAYWRFIPTPEWRQWFRLPPDAFLFGRTAVIECEDGPTVLLLEVVPEKRAPSGSDIRTSQEDLGQAHP